MVSRLISAHSISNDPEDPALEESTTDNQQFHGLNALQNTRKPPCADTQLRPVGAHSISNDMHRNHRRTFSVTGDCCRLLYSDGPQNGARLSTTTSRLLARAAPLARSLSKVRFQRTDWQATSRQPSGRLALSGAAWPTSSWFSAARHFWSRLANEVLLSAAWHSWCLRHSFENKASHDFERGVCRAASFRTALTCESFARDSFHALRKGYIRQPSGRLPITTHEGLALVEMSLDTQKKQSKLRDGPQIGSHGTPW